MKIGFTYDLRRDYTAMGFSDEETAEFDSDVTINAIERVLLELGYEVERIGNIYELTGLLAAGKRWDLVFNISEGLYGAARESQVPALLDAYRIPYTFSDPLALAVCLDKAVAKTLVMRAGVPTPEFFVVRLLEDILRDGRLHENIYPLFVKPLTEGTGKGISAASIVWDISAFNSQCADLLARFNQPVLAEKYLPGREFTAGIIGTGESAECIGVMEITLNKDAEPDVYSYLNKEHYEERVDYSLVEDEAIISGAADISLRAYRALGCRDAGRVDLKADAHGNLCFLEINPLAGLHPVRSDLSIMCGKIGIPYAKLISNIVDSALQRVRGVPDTVDA
ncbi:MAG: D-alanine--D-alanine ligase [Nitrospirota bacterium]